MKQANIVRDSIPAPAGGGGKAGKVRVLERAKAA
jgi:hypothetical protein